MESCEKGVEIQQDEPILSEDALKYLASISMMGKYKPNSPGQSFVEVKYNNEIYFLLVLEPEEILAGRCIIHKANQSEKLDQQNLCVSFYYSVDGVFKSYPGRIAGDCGQFIKAFLKNCEIVLK